MADFAELIESIKTLGISGEAASVKLTELMQYNVKEMEKERQYNLGMARLKQGNSAAFVTPSKVKSTQSFKKPPIESAMKETRGYKGELKVLLSQVSTNTSISLLANGTEVLCNEDEETDEWSQRLDTLMDDSDVRKLIGIPAEFTLSTEEVDAYGLIHNSVDLHRLGELEYQGLINQWNVDQRKCYFESTHATNNLIPVAKQHNHGMFDFSGKTDNISTVRPMALEIKGDSHDLPHKPSGKLLEFHFEVLQQAIRRVYSMSRIPQYVGNIGVFAVCFDRLWLVWYQRKMVPAELRQGESIHVIKVDPSKLGYYWALLTKQALLDRDVMFVEGNDARYLVPFLNNLHPKVAHYCRTRFVSMSMNRVYAVTLPQLFSNGIASVCVSKDVKHFAVKIIENPQEFEQEVQCIAQINEHISVHGCDLRGENNRFLSFYALGSQKWGEAPVMYNEDAIDLGIIRAQLIRVMKAPAAQASTRLRDSTALVPWWLYEPAPAQPLGGGVIVMLCGDYEKPIDASNIATAARGVGHWLDLVHNARVLHRDIRSSNIMRFNPPVVYTIIISTKDDVNVNIPASCLQWQLIDYNLGYRFDQKDSELVATTTLHKGSSQSQCAGLKLQTFLKEEERLNQHWWQLKYPWTFRDDREMLAELVFRCIPTPLIQLS